MKDVFVQFPWLSVVPALGAAGGLLNAAATSNLRVLPSLVRSARGMKPLLRIGLLGNMLVATVTSTICVWALRVPAAFGPDMNVGDLLLLLLTSGSIGFAAARLATNETDARLLREAVCRASASPAAPPDTVQAMETATPWDVFAATTSLMPPSADVWRFGSGVPLGGTPRSGSRH